MTPIYAYFNFLKLDHCSFDTAKDFYLTYDHNQSAEGSFVFIASPIKVNKISADPTTRATHYILLNREQVDAKLTALFTDPLTTFENKSPIEMMLIRTKPLTTQDVNDLFGFVPTINIIKAFPTPQAIRAQENEDYNFAKQQARDAKASINHERICANHSVRLITLLNESLNTITIQNATNALAHLAENSINQITIRKNRGIETLIALLNDCEDTPTKRHAARALTNIAFNPINHNIICENLGITTLIALLNTGDDPLTKYYATLAFARLAANPINQNTIRENFGITTLITLLNSRDNSFIKLCAVIALGILAENSVNQNTIRESFGIAPLIALLNTCDDPLIEQQATYALANLAVNPINQNIICENIGIAPLIALLNTSDNPVTKQQAARTLANLAANPINQNTIRESFVIETLIALLNYCEDTLTKRHAARALANIALNPINHHIILNNNGIIPLTALSKTNGDTQTQHYAANALRPLLINENYIKASIIGLAIIISSTTLTPEQLTIFNITNAILRAGMITLLVKTLISIQSTKQQLVDITENHRKNIYANTFIKLSDLLNQNLNTKTTRDAAHTLANLAENSINQNIIRESIDIPVLIALSNSCEDALTRQYAARALLLVTPTTNPIHQNTINDNTDISNINTSSVSTPTMVTLFSIFTPSTRAEESNTEMNIERNEEGHLNNLS